MVACEVILDRGVNPNDLHSIEHELLQYYLVKVAQKFPPALSGSAQRGPGGNIFRQIEAWSWVRGRIELRGKGITMMPGIFEPFLVGTIIGVTYVVVSKWREWTE